MLLTDLATHPLTPVIDGTDPFTLIYGGSVVGPDGRIAVADIVVSQGRIAEIGSCICIPEGAELVDAAGTLVRQRGPVDGAGTQLAPGQLADLEFVDRRSGQPLERSWQGASAAQH